jgi:hypothetical protein
VVDLLTLVSATIQDNIGVKAPALSYWITPSGLTLDAALTFYARTLADSIDAITDGQIVRFAVEFLPNPNADWGATIKTAPVVPSRVEQTGLFNFSQMSSKYKAPIDVPAIAEAVLLANGHIDLTNTDIAAFIALMTTAGPGSEQPVSKYQYDLLALLDASETFRKRRRQMIKATYENA